MPNSFENTSLRNCRTIVLLAAICGGGSFVKATHADEPAHGASKKVDLGEDVTLEVVSITPGEFMLGSTKEGGVCELE